jgi:hypothetical protein
LKVILGVNYFATSFCRSWIAHGKDEKGLEFSLNIMAPELITIGHIRTALHTIGRLDKMFHDFEQSDGNSGEDLVAETAFERLDFLGPLKVDGSD